MLGFGQKIEGQKMTGLSYVGKGTVDVRGFLRENGAVKKHRPVC